MRRLAPLLIAIVIGGCFVAIGDPESGTDSGAAGGGKPAAGAGGAGASGGGLGGAGLGGSANGGLGGGGSGGLGGAETDGSGGGALLFADDFSGDLSQWQAVGDGNWTVSDGEAQQTSPTASYSFMYVGAIDQADYRVVSRMRQVGSNNHLSGAVEIAFRIEPTKPSLYYCNWEPNDGRMVLMYLDGADQDVMLEKLVTLPGAYDAYAWFTMELTIIAGQIQCRVLELPGSELIAPAAPLFSSGHVGLKTWRMSGSFDWFEVYSP
jgi:hypothetical protein